MTPEETRYFHELQTAFRTKRLGEGDAAVGLNFLAAMACSVANIQPPGSCIVAPDETTTAIGTNLLVSGTHSASLISEKALNCLATRQNNLNSNIRGRERELTEEAKKSVRIEAMLKSLEAFDQETAFGELYREPGLIDDSRRSDLMRNLVEKPARTDYDEIRDRNQIFITGTSPEQLAKQLERCNLGHPLIHVGVGRPTDFARHEDQCTAVMDGRLTTGPMSENIRGTVMVTDPSGVLGEVVRGGIPSARWASRMLWLVDGNAGPEPGGLEKPADYKPPVALDNVVRRFESAVSKAMIRRISNQNAVRETVKYDFHGYQAGWLAFLKKMEPGCPGVTGAARNLLATLLFGFTQMVREGKCPDGFMWRLESCEALARYLVHRMANARAVMLRTAEISQREKLQAGILSRLADGPHEVRKLCRRFHNQPPSELCAELLLDLEVAGKVARSDKQWILANPEERAYQAAGPLTLES